MKARLVKSWVFHKACTYAGFRPLARPIFPVYDARAMAQVQIKKLRPKHIELLRLMIEYPHEKADFFAEKMGCTTRWLSYVINSDLFKSALQKFAVDHLERASMSVLERTEELAKTALDQLQDKLEDEEEVIPVRGLMEITDMALKHHLGDQRRMGNAPGVTVNIANVNPDVLQRARERAQQYTATPKVEHEQPPALEAAPQSTDVPAEAIDLGGIEDWVEEVRSETDEGSESSGAQV